MHFAERALVMMQGPAGAGKSTLADELLKAVPNALELDESAIFEDEAFAAVGAGFRKREWPTAELLLSAYERFFERAADAGAWIISDWNTLALIEELPCAQTDRTTLTAGRPELRADFDVLVQHARDVRDAAQIPSVLFVLDLPDVVAWKRAARQRGDAWLEKRTRHLVPRPGETLDDCIARDAAAWKQRWDDVIRAHEVAEWGVHVLDASAPEEVVFAQALHCLGTSDA